MISENIMILINFLSKCSLGPITKEQIKNLLNEIKQQPNEVPRTDYANSLLKLIEKLNIRKIIEFKKSLKASKIESKTNLEQLKSSIDYLINDLAVVDFLFKHGFDESAARQCLVVSDKDEFENIFLSILYEKFENFKTLAEYIDTYIQEIGLKKRNNKLLSVKRKIDSYINLEKFFNGNQNTETKGTDNRDLFIYYYLLLVNYPDLYKGPKPGITKYQAFKTVISLVSVKKWGKDENERALNFRYKAKTMLGRLWTEIASNIEYCYNSFGSPYWSTLLGEVKREIEKQAKVLLYFDNRFSDDLSKPPILYYKIKKDRLTQFKESLQGGSDGEFSRQISYDGVLNFIFAEENSIIQEIMNLFFGINGRPDLNSLRFVCEAFKASGKREMDYNLNHDIDDKARNYWLPLLSKMRKAILQYDEKSFGYEKQQVYKDFTEIQYRMFLLIRTSLNYYNYYNSDISSFQDALIHMQEEVNINIFDTTSSNGINILEVYEALFPNDASKHNKNAFWWLSIVCLEENGYSFNPESGLFEKRKAFENSPIVPTGTSS